MKNSADLGWCYSPHPSASLDNTLLDVLNSSYPTQPHSKIAKSGVANRLCVSTGMILLADHFKKFCLPVKTICSPTDNANETPA